MYWHLQVVAYSNSGDTSLESCLSLKLCKIYFERYLSSEKLLVGEGGGGKAASATMLCGYCVNI